MRSVIGVLLVVVLSQIGLTPAFAAASVTLTVNSFTRDAITGTLTWNMTGTAVNKTDSGCGWSCNFQLLGQRSDGQQVVLQSNAATTASFALAGSRGADEFYITAVRGIIQGTSVQTAWIAVSDSVAARSLALAINSISRSSTTGELKWNLTAQQSNTSLVSCGYPCNVFIEVKTATGATTTLAQVARPANYYSGSVSVVGSGGSTTSTYTHIRARLGSSSLTTGWLAIYDSAPRPFVSLAVNTLNRDPANGQLIWNLAAMQYNSGSTPCSYPCNFVIEAKTSTGATETLAQASRPANYFSGTATISGRGGSTTSTYTYLRARLGDSILNSGWIRVSENVQGGHDLDAAAAMWVAAAVLAADPCLELLPVGPHLGGSSLNDYQLACKSGILAGKSFSQIFLSLVQAFGVGAVSYFLVYADYADDPPATTTERPAEWVWVDYPFTQPVPPSTPPVVARPVTAPPLLDPLYENNIVAHMMRWGWIAHWGDLGAVGDELEHAREVARQCVAMAAWPGAGHTEEQCKTMPIFSPGSNVLEAAQHDHDAILGNASWSALGYRTVAEREADGISRSWYASYAECSPSIGVTNLNCDEFPFYSSVEGGPGASLRVIDKIQNQLEGNLLQGFANSCGLSNVAMPAPDRNYLVVPLPYSGGPLTSGWCNW